MEIKEIKELIAGLELLGCAGANVMADGKVDSSDFGSVIELLTKAGVLVEAVKGIKDISEEIKDLKPEEIAELGSLLYGMIIKIKAAYEAGKSS